MSLTERTAKRYEAHARCPQEQSRGLQKFCGITLSLPLEVIRQRRAGFCRDEHVAQGAVFPAYLHELDEARRASSVTGFFAGASERDPSTTWSRFRFTSSSLRRPVASSR